MIGAVLTASASQKVLSATCETSIIMPSAVHLAYYLFAEIGEAVVMLDAGLVDIAGRIGPTVGIPHLPSAGAVTR